MLPVYGAPRPWPDEILSPAFSAGHLVTVIGKAARARLGFAVEIEDRQCQMINA
jgi:hypothetical protein